MGKGMRRILEGGAQGAPSLPRAAMSAMKLLLNVVSFRAKYELECLKGIRIGWS